MKNFTLSFLIFSIILIYTPPIQHFIGTYFIVEYPEKAVSTSVD